MYTWKLFNVEFVFFVGFSSFFPLACVCVCVCVCACVRARARARVCMCWGGGGGWLGGVSSSVSSSPHPLILLPFSSSP